MKKRTLRKIVNFVLCAVLCMGLTSTVGAVKPPMEEWTNDNAIVVDVKEEYVEEVLADPKEAFAELNPTGAYVYSLRKWGAEEMELLLVLPESGEQAQQESMEALAADPRVSSARKCTGVPFETVNTLQLTADSDTIHVGETITIKPTGELEIYLREYSPYDLYIIPTDFDPEKVYTAKDFPSLPVEGIIANNPYYLHLELSANDSNYFHCMDVINTVAISGEIYGVWSARAPAGRRTAEFCMASDPSVAQFTNVREESYADDELVGIANENDEYVLKGLAPGKVTVTYYNHALDGKRYTAQMDIMVLDNEPQSSEVSNTPQSDSRESGYSQSNNPKTGDASPTAAAGLFVLAGGSGLWIVLRRKRI
ncbi:MAG: LPXTG cell wall anchor domain-containing protein [Clostridiales bacterium]|nr:LPXTG cell wall anchor domain-containing protein [Clostridiales bacterium]